AVVDSLEPVFQAEIGFSPRQVLTGDDLGGIDRIQTMLFVMQLGLAEAWRSRGVTPDAVIGHSVGEIAAAVTCGALTRQEGARLICRRSVLLRRVAGRGAMAMAALPFAEVERRLAGRTDLAAAIFSAPASTVVAGDAAAVEDLVERWRAEDVPMRRVASDVAFHSPHMDPLLAELAAAAADLSPAPARIPMYSTALDDPRAAPVPGGAYWAANLRNPVRLAPAVQAAVEDGYQAFLEVSAHPVVAHSLGETLAELGVEDTFVGVSLRRNRPERATLLAGAGAMHCHGLPLDWAGLQPHGALVTLPRVAWQRRRHWREAAVGDGDTQQRHDVDSHTLLGSGTSVAGHPLRLWRTLLDDECRPYPGSHTINGVEIVPAAVLVNTFLAAAPDSGFPRTVAEVSLRVPLTVAERRELQVLRDDGGVRLASRAQDENSRGDRDAGPGRPWLTHATATLPTGPAAALPGSLADAASLAELVDPALVQQHLASVGVPTMGFGWTVEELSRDGGRLRARVLAGQPGQESPTWGPVLDAALSIAPVAFPGAAVLRMVAHVDEVHIVDHPPATALIEIAVDQARAGAVDVLVADASGRVLARLAGLRYAVLDRDPAATADPAHLVHELVWRPLPLPAGARGAGAPRSVVVVGPDTGAAQALREQVVAAGAACHVVRDPAELEGIAARLGSSTDVLVLPPSPASRAAAAGTATTAVTGTAVTDAAARSAWLLTSTAQRLSTLDATQQPRLWCVTTGGVESRDEAHLAHAPLWGLGRVIAGEHPDLWGGVVDLPADGPGRYAGVLLEVMRAAPREDVVAVRDGLVSVARLVRPDGEPSRGPVQCRPDGTYLITGGLGVLGLEVARWLAERGARRLVLASRRALPRRTTWDDPVDAGTRRQIDAVRALEALGVTVRTVPVDIADAERAAGALCPDALGLPPVRGVVHAAGVLDNRLVPGVDEESIRTVLRPKVDGAWTLHRLFPPGSLDFLVLFSSCGHLLGLPGQASYGSANAFLDALAVHRRAIGGEETVSLGWTSWVGKGMAVNEVVDMELSARGVTGISAPEAFGAWDLAAGRGGGHYAVLGVVGLDAGMQRPPLLAELSTGDAGTGGGAAGTPQVDGLAGLPGLAGLTPQELRERLLDEVTTQIATEMKLPTRHLHPRRPLAEQGLDSVMTLVIRRRLEKRFGHSLPATLLWHQPTVTAIAEHLAELLSSGQPGGNGTAGPAVEIRPAAGG
ncbi:MAG TPA: acyltransferase domain-containing protein, partial [Micromonosporaceae bacterium]|nr:acyltransferase domain-containing protein [Micromonosporaceae bacterium]